METILDYVVDATANYVEHMPKNNGKHMDSFLPAKKPLDLWLAYLTSLLIKLRLQFLILELVRGFSPQH